MIDLEKYGFRLKRDFGDSVVYDLSDPVSDDPLLSIYFNGERYSFYSFIEDVMIDHLYMIKLDNEKDFEFILNNVRDLEWRVKAHSLF